MCFGKKDELEESQANIELRRQGMADLQKHKETYLPLMQEYMDQFSDGSMEMEREYQMGVGNADAMAAEGAAWDQAAGLAAQTGMGFSGHAGSQFAGAGATDSGAAASLYGQTTAYNSATAANAQNVQSFMGGTAGFEDVSRQALGSSARHETQRDAFMFDQSQQAKQRVGKAIGDGAVMMATAGAGAYGRAGNMSVPTENLSRGGQFFRGMQGGGAGMRGNNLEGWGERTGDFGNNMYYGAKAFF